MNQRMRVVDAARQRRRREREQAKEQTRKALMMAGLDELIERGVDAGLDSICGRAGYTRGAFYVHFRDREEFLAALTDWVIGSIIDEVTGKADEEAYDLSSVVYRFAEANASQAWPLEPKLATVATRLIDAIDRFPAVRERLGALLRRAIDRLETGIRREQEAGGLDAELDAEALATLILIVALGAVVLNKSTVPIDHVEQGTLLLNLLFPDGLPRNVRARD